MKDYEKRFIRNKELLLLMQIESLRAWESLFHIDEKENKNLGEKQAKNINAQFIEEKMQIAKKHIKR